ncbi:MAG TPA: transcription factor [Methanocorpusculum sp.]|nr:transcription factor [Methanocorpusculum sp.]
MTTITSEQLENPAIYQYLLKLVGEDGLELIRKYPDKELCDEDIAKKTDINLNTVRHTLYHLYERRLAEYTRIKNNETGWLTYLWTLRMDNLNQTITSELKTVRDKLTTRLKYDEKNDFYQCKNCGLMTTFNNASRREFKCDNCGKMLVHFDADILVSALKKRVDLINEELSDV